MKVRKVMVLERRRVMTGNSSEGKRGKWVFEKSVTGFDALSQAKPSQAQALYRLGPADLDLPHVALERKEIKVTLCCCIRSHISWMHTKPAEVSLFLVPKASTLNSSHDPDTDTNTLLYTIFQARLPRGARC